MQKAADSCTSTRRADFSASEFEVEPLAATSAVDRLFLVQHQRQSVRASGRCARYRLPDALAILVELDDGELVDGRRIGRDGLVEGALRLRTRVELAH